MAKRMRDSDEKWLRKRNMRLKFKKLVRSAIMNQQWLDDSEDQSIVMNAKKNVALLVRQKRKTGLLTVAEKALLRTSPSSRTVEDRKKLCMIISGLSCFAHIPPKLRARLIPYLKFTTIGGDRVLIKRDDQPITVYFMISGEVELKKTIYDKATKKFSMVSEAIMGAGDLLGEVEILEKCTRISTFVAISPCEVLSITDDEFHAVLGPYMFKQWHEKKMALRSLNYFDFLTDAQIVRACNYCQLAQYDPLQSIYSEDRGAISCVHFILSGECVILQCLKMTPVTKRNGTKSFELISARETNKNLFQASTKSMRSLSGTFTDPGESKDKMLSDSYFNINELLASSSDLEDEETLQQKKAMRKMGLRDIEISCGLLRSENEQQKKQRKTRTTIKRQSLFVPKYRKTCIYPMTEEFEDELFDDELSLDYTEEAVDIEDEETVTETDSSDKQINAALRKSSVKSDSVRNYTVETARFSGIKKSIEGKMEKSLSMSKSSVHIKTESIVEISASSEDENTTSSSLTHRVEMGSVIPKNTETHFIDVGSLTYGGIFGLGEKMAHRVIMARTVVQCLLLPRYWLMEDEQNPGDIWKRRKFYLEGSIPSREELFGNFLKTRRWEKFKRDYVQSTLNPNSANSTQPEDIPIICRIVETRDDI